MISNINKVAAFATFTNTEFTNWKNSVIAIERALTQTLRTNTHTNHSNNVHTNSGGHYNGTDRDSSHNNSGGGHYNSRGHSNGTASHSNGGSHGDGTTAGGSHYDRINGSYSVSSHYNQAPHSNGTNSHSNSTHNNNTHYNGNNHNNRTNSVHSNVGFNHQNFVPSKTHIMNIANNTKLKGTVRLGFHSYDRNIDGHGTQDAVSRDVMYHVRIRKVRNLNGTNNASAWRTLLNWVATDNLMLNTIDPLADGTTNKAISEGFYEIEMTARNNPITALGVTQTYVGPTTVVTVMIKQNELPTIVATNTNQFLNFSFSEFGVTNANRTVSRSYEETLYNERADMEDGLLVVVNITDLDGAENWLRASGRLVNSGGATLAGTQQDLIFAANNATSIRATGGAQKAYYYIPKSVLRNLGTLDGVRVEFTVSDFENSTLTVPTGDVVTQMVIGGGNNTNMTINIDNTKPVINLSKDNDVWRTENTVTIQTTDAKSILRLEYQWVKKGEAPVEANYQVIPNNSTVQLDKPPTGIYNLVTRSTDMTRNVTVRTSGDFYIDNTASIVNHTLSAYQVVNTDVTITVTATDEHSGVRRMRVKGGTWVNGSTISRTVPANGTYEFEVEDNAGFITPYSVTINNIDKTPPQVAEGGIKIRKTKVSGDRVFIEFDQTKISDNYTPTPQIMFKTDTLDWTPMRGGISDELVGGVKTVYLRDLVGNISTFTPTILDDWKLGAEDTDKTDDSQVKEIKSLSPTIPEPPGGTHYSISFDGVTWSDWEEKTGSNIKVNLPSGEGFKGVYVRAGVKRFVDTPVSTRDGIKYIREELEEIEPIDIQDRYHFAYDKTPPNLEIRTATNLWVTDSSNRLPMVLFVEDNMSENVTIRLSLLDGTGQEIPGSQSSYTVESGTERDININFTPLLPTLKPDPDKSGTVLLRFEAEDASGNVRKVIKSVTVR